MYGPPGYPAPQAPARQAHPSETLGLFLALAGLLCTAGVLSIPALLVIAKAKREAQEQPTRWYTTGVTALALVAGWLGVALLAFVAASIASQTLVSAALVALLATVALAALAIGWFAGPERKLPPPLGVLAATARRFPLAVGVPAIVALSCSALMLVGHVSTHVERAAGCSSHRSEYTAAAAAHDGARMESAMNGIIGACDVADTEQAAMNDAVAKQLQADGAAATYARATAAQAAAAAKEAKAQADFPDASAKVSAELATEQTDSRAGKLEDADTDLKIASRLLDEFAGTTVTSSDRYRGLITQISDRRQALQPRLDHARAARDASAAAAAAARIEASATPVGRLLADYKNNEIRADAQYKDQTIVISGVVGDVKRDMLGTLYVTVGTGAMFELPIAQCYFSDSYARRAAGLDKGDHVLIRGRVDGLMMNVLIKDAEFAN